MDRDHLAKVCMHMQICGILFIYLYYKSNWAQIAAVYSQKVIVKSIDIIPTNLYIYFKEHFLYFLHIYMWKLNL